MFVWFLIGATSLFAVTNSEALNAFKAEQDAGAEWHYVGKQAVDPNAKSIAINGEIDGKPTDVIYWKLKMPDENK